MSKVEVKFSIEKFIESILLLSFIYNLIYNLSLIDVDVLLSSECNFEFLKFAIVNFIMSYIAIFVLFFGVSINRRLLYLATITMFLLAILTSKYFLSFYERTTFADIYAYKSHLPLLPIISTFFFAWYLVYYIARRHIINDLRSKILMSLCLALYIVILWFYNIYPEKDKPYFVTKMMEVVHLGS
jgi:hypothetical protein